MKSASVHYVRTGFAAALIALLAGCYGTSYVGVRHDSWGHRHYGYSSYPYHGTRYYSHRPYYRPYAYRYYSGYGGPSLNLSYSRTTYRSPSYSSTRTYGSAPSYSSNYGYRTSSPAPRYSGTTYVTGSPATATRSTAATNRGKAVHGKKQAHVKHKGNKHDR